MGFKSLAQVNKFFTDPKLRKHAEEWLKTTPSVLNLPKRVKKEGKKRV